MSLCALFITPPPPLQYLPYPAIHHQYIISHRSPGRHIGRASSNVLVHITICTIHISIFSVTFIFHYLSIYIHYFMAGYIGTCHGARYCCSHGIGWSKIFSVSLLYLAGFYTGPGDYNRLLRMFHKWIMDLFPEG